VGLYVGYEFGFNRFRCHYLAFEVVYLVIVVRFVLVYCCVGFEMLCLLVRYNLGIMRCYYLEFLL